MERQRGSNAFLAFLVGGIVGAGAAMLFSPYSGQETRRKIRDGLEDAQDWAKDMYQDARYKVSEGSDKVKQFVADKREDLSSAVEAGKEAYRRGRERLSREA